MKPRAMFGALALAGCAVGPKVSVPPPPDMAAYTPAPVQTAPGQRLVPGMEVPREWWRAFGSAKLDALVADALAHSPTLASAEATLKQLREQYRVQRGGRYPSVTLDPSYTRGRESLELQPPVSNNNTNYTVISAGAQVTFNPDVFGGLRRTAEGARASADAAAQQLRAARATLIGNVVTTTIQLASFDAQIAEAHRALDAQASNAAIGRRQEREGQIARADVAALDAQRAQSEAALPSLERSRGAARDQLALLTGRTPDRAPTDLPTLDELRLPVDVPLTIPSRLVETRPDIRAAAAQLHVAAAAVGVAAAARLPVFNLTANAGGASQAFQRLFKSENLFWTLIAGFTAPVLDAGTLLHGERAARAGLNVARAGYRSAVLIGLQNVADTLEAMGADAHAVVAAEAARDAARRSLSFAALQYREGQASAQPLLIAQATDANAAGTDIQARASRMSDTALLYVALGGGQ